MIPCLSAFSLLFFSGTTFQNYVGIFSSFLNVLFSVPTPYFSSFFFNSELKLFIINDLFLAIVLLAIAIRDLIPLVQSFVAKLLRSSSRFYAIIRSEFSLPEILITFYFLSTYSSFYLFTFPPISLWLAILSTLNRTI